MTSSEILNAAYSDDNGGIDVNVQSQTSPLFQYLLMNNIKKDITLTAEVSVDDEVVNVSVGHGFTGAAGEYILIRYGDIFLQQRVVSVATNEITIEMPIDNDFPVLGTTITRGNVKMNVDGSSTPVKFDFGLTSTSGALIPIDISSIVITMQSGAAVPDDGTFGGIAALTTGMYFRKVDGEKYNLGNYRVNQDFKTVGARVEYTEKSPSGTNGTNIYFKIEEIFGQVIRLDPKTNDSLCAFVRDNLNTFDDMVISIIGSLTRGE